MRAIVVGLVVFGSIGCHDPIQRVPSFDESDASTLGALEQEVGDLNARLDGLTDDVDDYQTEIAEMHDLTTSGTTQMLADEQAVFVVALDGMEAIHDGDDSTAGISGRSRLFLRIGNLSPTGFAHGTVRIRWGLARPDRPADWSRWSTSLQEVTTRFEGELRPGDWNDVAVTLPSPIADIGYVEVTQLIAEPAAARVPRASTAGTSNT